MRYCTASPKNTGIAPDVAADVPLIGEATQLAEEFAHYAEAGAGRITLSVDGGDWYRAIEVIAAVKALPA